MPAWAVVDEHTAADVGTIEYLGLRTMREVGGGEGASTDTAEVAAREGLAPRALVVRANDATRRIIGVSAGKAAGQTKRARQRKRAQRRVGTFGILVPPSAPPASSAAAPAAPATPAGELGEGGNVRSAAAEPLGPGSYVRLVVISDTHGLETQLTRLPGQAEDEEHTMATAALALPKAEVLVHCGDWCKGAHDPAVAKRQAEALDVWLAAQPQPHKLVLRGNHDPYDTRFPRSGAKYVTSPQSVRLGAVTFACVPYSKGPLRGLLPKGEVLVSHVPPKRVLDKTYTGEDAGDDSLRKAVKDARDKPRVWLFGHIHEGAGAARVRFGARRDDATTLVNAANANPGPAKRLVTGPVVLELEVDPDAPHKERC